MAAVARLRRREPTTIAELGAWVSRVEIRCARCDRRGLVRISTLVAQHGADMTLNALLRELPGDCPKRHADRDVDRCSVALPDLFRIAEALHGPIEDWGQDRR